MLKAVVFDIDGTLVDSVDVHAMAWHEALRRFGFDARYEEVRAQIGKGADKLIPTFVPAEQVGKIQQKLSDFRSDLFKREYLPRIRPFACVRNLLERIRGEGLRIALASSAKGDELDAYVKIADIAGLFEEGTSKDDVEESKPSPDVFHAALAKLKDVRPEEAIVIGDTPYDATAARDATLECIGVLTGGWTREELYDAGCVHVYRNVAEMYALFEESPLAVRLKEAA